jgi:hypothetical protein
VGAGERGRVGEEKRLQGLWRPAEPRVAARRISYMSLLNSIWILLSRLNVDDLEQGPAMYCYLLSWLLSPE